MLAVLAAVVLVAQGVELNYTQDDAFISLAYAANLVDGFGLVFNQGERVEGYTNLLWTLLLTIPLLIGVDPMLAAKSLGVLSSVACLPAVTFVVRQIDPARPSLASVLAVLLTGFNGALAFWAVSGMETALFTALFTVAVGLCLREARLGTSGYLVSCVLALTALTRPEGALLFVVATVYKWTVLECDFAAKVRVVSRWALPFVAIVGIHILIRITYYDLWLPNTFFAKTNSTVGGGSAYLLRFVIDYGLCGATFLAALCIRGSQSGVRKPWIIPAAVLSYSAYVWAIGGDVWPEHRFLLPLLPILNASFGLVAASLVDRFLGERRAIWIGLAVVALLAWTFLGPRQSLLAGRDIYKEHNRRLHLFSDYLIETYPDARQLTVATATIGIPKYTTGARVIDITGLTDTTITQHPEQHVGVTAHPGDRLLKYNSQYVLDQRPDFVFFLTGLKPIKAAEKALMLNPEFRSNYYVAYMAEEFPVFRRRELSAPRSDAGPADPAFLERFISGLNHESRDWHEAKMHFTECTRIAPDDFCHCHERLGLSLLQTGARDEAKEFFEVALSIDSHCVKAMIYLAQLALQEGDFQRAEELAMRSSTLSPGSQQAHLLLGLATLTSRPKDAIESLAQAVIAKGPNRLEAMFYLGLAHARLGHLDVALALWREVLEEDPSFARAARAIDNYTDRPDRSLHRDQQAE